jgi:MraZ protein
MFLGKDSNRIDDKGRLAIPAKFREVVGQGARLVVTRKVLDPCLEVYTEADWRAFMEKLQGLSQVKEEVRRYRRLIFSGAEVCNLDRQGRVLIPTHLREYAGLTRDTVLVGTGTTIEIWDATRWAGEVDRDLNAAGLADALADLGL